MKLRVGRAAVSVAIVSLTLAASAAEGRSTGIRSTPEVAACSQWNATGTWKIAQSNVPAPGIGTFHIKQRGTVLAGNAVATPYVASTYGTVKGSITGTLKGDRLRLVVHWRSQTGALEPSKIGGYDGSVSKHRMAGQATNLGVRPFIYVSWSTRGMARCARR